MGIQRATLTHRPAFDGVRALAVAAVVAYHLGLERLPGGFLGVVFFVLSGYLITMLLLLERDASGRIDIPGFWVRRVKRLLPALLLVLVVSTIWIHQTAPDFELVQRRIDLEWALFYGSNWHMIASAQDYFASGAGVSIVRHTWSLAIEEQFYVAWPPIVGAALWVSRGRVRYLVTLCVAGIGGSLVAMSLLHANVGHSRAYYGTDTRAHQILIGALLAIAMLRMPAVRAPRRAGSAIGALCFVVLLATFTTIDDASTLYYRGGSVMVALAAAGLIWSLEVAHHGFVARAIGVRPMRGAGRISYGIYLWHWPVIAVIRLPAAPLAWLPGTTGLILTRLAITLAVALLSFLLVERPVQRGRIHALGGARLRIARATVGGLAIITVIGMTAVAIAFLTAGTPLQAEASTRGGAAELDEQGCDLEICVRYNAGSDAPTVAVIGDSVARSLDLGFVESVQREGWTYVTASAGGCRVSHLLTMADGSTGAYRRCFETTPGLFRSLQARWTPDVVVIIESVEMADFARLDGRVVHGGSPEWEATETRSLSAVVDRFERVGAHVVLVGAAPVILPAGCLRRDGADDPACVVPAENDVRASAFNAILSEIASDPSADVTFVDTTAIVCPGGRCSPTVDGVFARYDGHHYSKEGAGWLVPHLLEEMREEGVPLGTPH